MSILWIGCAKEQGCTDNSAVNYDSAAEENDNSCTYEGSMVVYYDETTSNTLVADDAVSLTYYLDNQVIGSSAANVFFVGNPNCGDNGTISVTKSLGSSKSKSYNLQVIDQTGFIYWDLNVALEANVCLALEIE